MKKLFLFLLLIPLISAAQEKYLYVEGNSPDLYITHRTGVKENYYSIGRIYNISPRVVAPFNNLQLENGLAINQVIKIPLTEQNYAPDGNAADDEVLVPLYHKAKNKETLQQISNYYNRIPVASLKKWNRLNSDVPANGSNVIIGYLKVKKDLSSLASRAVKVDASSAIMQNELGNPEPVIPKKPEAVVQVPPVKKETVITGGSEGRSFNGGAFRNLYTEGKNNETGTAGVFKSTSGWEDGKYYCLHNKALAGTIIKITNTLNNKVVYAKVLDVIPDLKQNEGMVLRLSNAAASELGVTGTTFESSLNY